MMDGVLGNRFTTAVLLTIAGALIAGVLTAILLPNGQTTTAPGAEAQVVSAPDGRFLSVVQQVDERVSFPPELSELPVAPGALAVDSRGSVWIPLFCCGDSGHLLYRYDPDNGNIDRFSLPDNPGTSLSSAIAVSPAGAIVTAYGGIVAVLDPAAGSFKTYDLPANSPYHVKFGADEGTYVTDMAVGPDNVAYVTRMNTAAVTLVDLATGATSEVPVDGSSGPLFAIEVSGEAIYVANWSASGGSRLVRLTGDGAKELAADAFAFLALAGADDRVYTLLADGTLAAYGNGSAAVLSETKIPGASLGASLVVDPAAGAVWVAGEGSSLSSWDPATGATQTLQLPSYFVPANAMRCPWMAECEGATLQTKVGGLAVAPTGDVYFADSTINRIGVIKAAE